MVYDFGVDEAQLARCCQGAAQARGLLELHCEDRGMLDARSPPSWPPGETGPRHHADSRPPDVEGTGTARAIALAAEAGAPMYAVHLSCAEALAHVAAARARGQRGLRGDVPALPGAGRVALPERPDRTPSGFGRLAAAAAAADQDALWAALAGGTLDLVATDHVPDRLAVEKRYTGQPFTEISNGAPGIETLLAIVYSEGVAKGRITDRAHGRRARDDAGAALRAAKGAIEVGLDADLVLFDPARARTIRQADLHHTSDYTPYEGRRVIRDGAFTGRRGSGRFQERNGLLGGGAAGGGGGGGAPRVGVAAPPPRGGGALVG